MRKSKPTVQHLITGYLISTGTTRENDVATRQLLLLNQSSRQLIQLNKKIHSKCFLHPKGKQSSFQCSTLRKALGAPPTSANKDNKEKVSTSSKPFQRKIQHASYSIESSIGLTPGLIPNKGQNGFARALTQP